MHVLHGLEKLLLEGIRKESMAEGLKHNLRQVWEGESHSNGDWADQNWINVFWITKGKHC